MDGLDGRTDGRTDGNGMQIHKLISPKLNTMPFPHVLPRQI